MKKRMQAPNPRGRRGVLAEDTRKSRYSWKVSSALPLRAALTRGALVTVANWPVVAIDFAIESLYKVALAVPIVGGAFMVAILAGVDVSALFAEGLRSAAEEVVASLTHAPVALACFVLAVVLVAFGGALVMFLIKAGTLTVLVDGERRAGEFHREPFRLEIFRRAYAYTAQSLIEGSRKFGSRAMTLVTWLGLAYGVIAAAYLLAMSWAVDLAGRSTWAPAWPIIVLIATSAAVVAVAAANLVYDLMRIIIICDDCRVGQAWKRLRLFLVADARQVIGLFGVVGALLLLATAASILATAGLALVAWVPVVGLVVVPLQLAAWLVRGLLFQYLGLAALSAYQTQYRRFAEPGDSGVPSQPFLVSQE